MRNITDEIPFEIPDSWAWVRLGQLCSLENGKKVENLHLPLLDAKFLRAQRTATLISKGIKVEKGELVILVDGENSGEVFIAPENGFLGSTFKKLFITPEIYREYTLIILKFYQNLFRNSKRGAAIPHLDKHLFHDLLIGLPPLEEQKLIVARIEVLEPLIEDYDQAETELSKLNETFPEQIKKSILQYAIQGKLVPQNPGDEPASVLLEKIKAEKQNLTKAGKIRKDKVESYIYKRDNRHYEKIGDKEIDITDEIPFEIPDNWAWVRFKNLVHYHMGKTPQRKNEDFWGNGTFPWVSIADLVSDGFLNTTKEKISSHALSHIFKGDFSPKGTLLMSFKLTVGKTSILGINAVHNEAIISIYPYLDTDNIMRNYLFKFMPLLSQDGQTKTAIKGKTLNSDSIDALLIPLPPLNEQKQIISKLEELLKILSCRY